jgi:hypothetical protein
MKILKLGQMLGGSNSPSGAGFENLYSLDFDGVNDVLTIPNNTIYTPTSSGWTISYWIKTSTINKFVLAKSNASSNLEFNCNIAKTTGYSTIQFFGNNDANIWQSLKANVNVGDGNWHHVVFTFNNTSGSGSIDATIDGVYYSVGSGNATYYSTGTWASPTNTAEPMNFGTATPYPAFVGNIDEISIFDSVLNPSTRVDMYNSGTPTDLTGATDLQGWWRNGDTAGTSVYPTIEDYSSVGNDGTMTNMASGDIVTVVP